MARTIASQMTERAVLVNLGTFALEGDLTLPEAPVGLVLFAHGSGSSRFSPRNRHVARILNEAGLVTMLVDLLTKDEERSDAQTGHLRFDIGLLADRLTSVADWLTHEPDTQALSIGCFGASTGAAAALVTAAQLPDTVNAVVSRGARTHAAHCRRQRRAGDPAELRGIHAAELRKGARHRPGCDASVRGAGDAGYGRAARAPVVLGALAARRFDPQS
jgi:dienelactone hydrolase